MFLPLSEKIDNNKLFDNYEKIKNDYIKFRDNQYFFDYSHEYNLTSMDDNFEGFIPKKENYFWKVCPFIFNRKVIQRMPEEVRNCFTTNLIMSMDVLPVLAVFSILEPHSKIDPHIDTDERIAGLNSLNSVVKYHYSLDIPFSGQSGLVVGDKQVILKNKDLNPFDERTVHYAYNQSDQPRGVLILSYIRKELYSA